MTINSANAHNYRLQNATIAALVNRGSFALKELEVPDFRLIVGEETFRISENIYPMKQPGQTILGAVAYLVLREAGIDYQVHYLYASQLVTMYTSALLTALASVVMYLLASQLVSSEKAGILAALMLVFGTMIWPYAGVTHHDIYGLFLIILAIACYCLAHKEKNKKYYFGAGVLAGLSWFFTMLPLPIPIVMWIVGEEKKWLGGGILVGLIPTLLFNLLVFGKPWLAANLAGKVADTVPLLSLGNLGQKLWFYLGDPSSALWAFSPILIFGVMGIIQLKAKDVWLKKLLIAVPIAQLVYVSSIETIGGYQYGPRYLIPILPFLGLGIANWLKVKQAAWKQGLFCLAGVYSILVALGGAIEGVMVPINEGYGPYRLWNQILAGEWPVMRVWKYGAVMIVVSGMILVLSKRDKLPVKQP